LEVPGGERRRVKGKVLRFLFLRRTEGHDGSGEDDEIVWRGWIRVSTHLHLAEVQACVLDVVSSGSSSRQGNKERSTFTFYRSPFTGGHRPTTDNQQPIAISCAA